MIDNSSFIFLILNELEFEVFAEIGGAGVFASKKVGNGSRMGDPSFLDEVGVVDN